MCLDFCDKIFMNLVYIHELLVLSTLTSSSKSHTFNEDVFVNKIFVIQEQFTKIAKFLDHGNWKLYVQYVCISY